MKRDIELQGRAVLWLPWFQKTRSCREQRYYRWRPHPFGPSTSVEVLKRKSSPTWLTSFHVSGFMMFHEILAISCNRNQTPRLFGTRRHQIVQQLLSLDTARLNCAESTSNLLTPCCLVTFFWSLGVVSLLCQFNSDITRFQCRSPKPSVPASRLSCCRSSFSTFTSSDRSSRICASTLSFWSFSAFELLNLLFIGT